uniref:Uncharacterized protein n=1 Tax=viral metagenome TaxID=1070528 RepID=A0A6H1ZQH0_9ZZZZ
MISPSDACERISPLFPNLKAMQTFLLTYAGSGKIYVDAETTHQPGKNPAPNKRVPPDHLRRLKCTAPLSFWRTATWVRGKTEMVGIRFCQEDVDSLAKTFAGNFCAKQSRNDDIPNSGRLSEKHGYPLATIALRYKNEPLEVLARLTGESLLPELEEEYKKQTWGIPSQTSLKALGVGVKRALLANRYEQDGLSNPQES